MGMQRSGWMSWINTNDDLRPRTPIFMLKLDNRTALVRKGKNGWVVIPRLAAMLVPARTTTGCLPRQNFAAIHQYRDGQY